MNDLRTAAQQALEAWQVATYGHPSHHKATLLAMTALRAALAEPVEEPVGEVVAIDFSEESGPEAIVTLHQDVELGTMLYAALPQRKPLTEEAEPEGLCEDCGMKYCECGERK